MLRRKIYLGNPETALRFIQDVDHTTAAMTIVSESNMINAKSILALFSLDLTIPHTLEIRGENIVQEKALDTVIQGYTTPI